MNNFYKLNRHHFWQAFAGAAAGNLPSPTRTILERRDTAMAHDWAVEDMHTMNRWQEQMSNSAHQREVKDLRSAGLNPILSGTGGAGASAGSSASPSNPETPDNKELDISGALDVLANQASVKLMKAQEHAANSAADSARANARKTNKEADILGPKSFIYDKIEEGIRSGAEAIKSTYKDYKQRYDNAPTQERP